jgi:hypothetical protein
MQWQADHSPACRKSPPQRGLFSAARLTQQQDQDDQGNRNADQPEENGHVGFFQALRELLGRSATPCAVAEAAAFGQPALMAANIYNINVSRPQRGYG